MEFDAVIRGRHSVRDFDGKPVSETDIRAIVAEAGLAPSWGDTQPWRVYVATGKAAEQIRTAHEKAVAEGAGGHSDIPTTHRTTWGEQPRTNMADFGKQTRALPADAAQSSQEKAARLHATQEQGQGQEARGRGATADGRPAHPAPMAVSNARLFNAGTIIYLALQKQLNGWNMLDLGAFEEALALSARNHGYDTVVAYEFVRYPQEVRPVLGIPEDEALVIGLGIGHATDAPINSLKARRMPVDEYLTIRE